MICNFLYKARILLYCLLPLMFLTSCERAKQHPLLPNVILITIDTLRTDHLSLYGYQRKTTPFLETLANQGSVFTNCYATSSWTAPSMASLFTSLYPSQHGVRHGIGNRKKQQIRDQEILSDSFLTLAEALRFQGYKTYGISSNMHITEHTGMDQGFDQFFSLGFSDAVPVHETALSLKKQLNSGEHFFLWIHYFDPHSPYKERSPWIEEYAGNREIVHKWSGKKMRPLRGNPQKKIIGKNQEILDALLALYDSEINHTDAFIRRLFREVLPEENNLVILTADHGEAFLEHGALGHAKSLFNEEVRVPCIIIPPKNEFKTNTISTPVSILDVYPTILDYLGYDIPAYLEGKSLLTLLSEPKPETRLIYSELDRGSRWRSVVSGNWKFIYGRKQSKKTGKLVKRKAHKEWLFDLTTDPAEKNNLLHQKKEISSQLKKALAQWQNKTPKFKAPQKKIQLSAEQENKLKSFGYLQ